MFGKKKQGESAVKQPKVLTEVVFHAYPKLVFIWPLILAGLLFWPLAGGQGPHEVLGWIYLVLLGIVILTIGVDLERNQAVFWLVVFFGFFFLGRWLVDVKHFTLFGNIYRWFGGLNVNYDRGFGLSLSVLLLVPYSIMFLWVWVQHRWRITHNEFEHYSWGRADDSLARGAKRVRSTYPDLLELLLCGCGTLIVYSATGRSELRRIPHVPLIFFVRKRLNRLLESTAVTSTSPEVLAAEESQAEESEADSPGSPGSPDVGGGGGGDPL